MKMKEEYIGNIKTFIFEGRLDSISTPAIQKQILSAIEHGETRLMIDLGSLDYISSAGIRALVLIQKEIDRRNGTLYLADVSKTVESVFQITGFLSLFTIVKKSDVIYTPDKGE
jgi:anti-anti-sigma factor